jgi:hypothetical protein
MKAVDGSLERRLIQLRSRSDLARATDNQIADPNHPRAANTGHDTD